MKPIQNQYQDLLEGKMSKSNFLTNVKRSLSDYVSNITSFDDAVKILKNKRILSEVEVKKENTQFDFHKAAIESASGDKVEKREEDDEGNPLYFSLNDEYVNYYIGSNDQIIKYNGETGERYPIGNLEKYDHTKEAGYTDEYDEFQQDRERHLPESLNEDWGSSDQATFNSSIHDDLGEPEEMPMPFDPKFEAAVESAVDFWWDEWDEYATDRDGLINKAKRAYYRSYFPEDFKMLTQMFSENKEEDDAIIATYEDEQDAKHTLPGGHLREDVDITANLVADIDKVNPLEYNTGIDYELDLSGDFSAEGLQKAVKKVLKNLAKDTIYYTNLKASLTQKINKKQVVATELVQVKKDNHTDELNKLKTLVKKEMANTKNTLGKKEKASSATPKGVKLMKENQDVEKAIKSGKIKPEEVKAAAEKAMKGDSTDLAVLMSFGGKVGAPVHEEEKFDLNKYNKDLFKKQSKEFTDKLTKPVTQKNTLKDKIKELVVKQLKKEAVKFTIGQTGQEHEYKNPKDAPEFEKDLRSAGVKFVKSNV